MSGRQETLGLIIDELIDHAQPDVAEAINLCPIPHWFNQEILARLRGEGREPSGRTGEILGELTKLVFVSPYHDRGYAYHEDVRNLLLGRWRKENRGRFQELSGKMAAYCADMLRVKTLFQEQRAEWEREEMYHLMVADEERGIDLFIRLSNRAGELYQLSTFHLLLTLAYERAADLSAGNRPWIQFFEGKMALLSGDWEEALNKWETLEGERERISVELEKALAIHLSFLYKDKGNWDKAVECFNHSLEILERVGDQRGLITILNNRGFLYKDKEEWKKAEDDFQRSLMISEKIGDEHAMVISFNNLGILYKDQGDWDRAMECFRRGQEILGRMGDQRGLITILTNLGFLYKDREEWEKAEEYFQLSLQILKKVGDDQARAANFNSLGFLYTDKKEWAEAGRYFRRALRILKKVGDERRRADTFSYLGVLYRDQEQWKKADEYFQRGLEILEKMDDERGMAVIFHNLGLLYKRKGEWEKAADNFQHSLKIVERVGDEMNAATTMYESALLYEDLQQYDKAVELLEKVVKISDQVGHPDSRIRKSREKLEVVKKRQED
jgi:tetratricopeptide (TPR) repeat protein